MKKLNEYADIEAQIEAYLATLKDAVAMLNTRIDDLQRNLYIMREKVSQLKEEDKELLEMGTAHILY